MSFLTRLYNWVSDRDNGIPITASRMDGEFDNIVAGVNTLYNDLVGGEWVAETNSFLWVAATQFKVVGVDVSAVYHVGRRVKVVHNGGATTSYGTVSAVAFSTDTTITLAIDGGASLVSTITAVSYGLLSFANPSYLDPRSQVVAAVGSNITYTKGTPLNPIAFNSNRLDTLSEYDAVTNHRFTAKHPGIYWVQSHIQFQQSSSDTNLDIDLIVRKNGTQLFQNSNTGIVPGAVDNVATVDCIGIASLVKGDYLDSPLIVTASGFVLQAPNFTDGSYFCVMRLV